MIRNDQGVDQVGTDEDLICSGKGCPQEAVVALLWNNPKLHTVARRKVWLSCDEHRDHLTHFLDVRGFLKDVIGVEELERVDA